MVRSRSLLVLASAAFLCSCFFSSNVHAQLEDLRGDPSATEHYIPDDGYVEIPLEFGFPFYGRTFTRSWMFSNGVIGFLEPRTSFCCTGFDIESIANGDTSFYDPNALSFTLLPFQTDLINYGDGKFMTRGDEESMTYGWYGISEFGRPDSSNNFEAEIYADGMYQFRYGDLDLARGVTIGTMGDLTADGGGQYELYKYGYLPPNGIETITSYGLGGQCVVDPLADPNCPGYADAYAQLQYQQNCFADPLYDSGCPGYAQAFFLEQCSIDPLYDSTCDGYSEAFLEQQCDRDPTYSASCDGYSDAVEERERGSRSSTASTSPPSVESITEPRVTGDATVDEVLRDSSNNRSSRQQSRPSPRPTPRAEPAPASRVEPAPVREREPREETRSESRNSENETEKRSESEISERQQQTDEKETSEKRSDRRKKLKEIAEDEARSLAADIGRAASIEQQQAIQARVLSLISYVPDFASYAQRGIPQPTDYYRSTSIYDNLEVPDSNFGARNGLAQEILHRRMVDMQYNNKEGND